MHDLISASACATAIPSYFCRNALLLGRTLSSTITSDRSHNSCRDCGIEPGIGYSENVDVPLAGGNPTGGPTRCAPMPADVTMKNIATTRHVRIIVFLPISELTTRRRAASAPLVGGPPGVSAVKGTDVASLWSIQAARDRLVSIHNRRVSIAGGRGSSILVVEIQQVFNLVNHDQFDGRGQRDVAEGALQSCKFCIIESYGRVINHRRVPAILWALHSVPVMSISSFPPQEALLFARNMSVNPRSPLVDCRQRF